jgi:putative MATE family efflux protein
MKQKMDFTQGSIWMQMVTFSLPIMATNALQVSYQIVDSLWVGNLIGASALGAVALSGTVIFTVLAFVVGLNNATLTILSQQKGKQNNEGLKNYLNAFIVLLFSLSVLLGVVGYFLAEPILSWMGTPSGVLIEAKVYLQINFLGVVFLIGYNFISTVLRALGDSRTPLRFVFMAVMLNLVLDPLFIAVFDWGIQGAAIATVLSQSLALLYGVIVMLRRKLAPFTVPKLPAKQEVVLILKLGIPAGLQMAVISAGIAAVMSVVNSFGEHAVAGFGAAQRLDSVIMLPAMALGSAVNSMAGQNIGAGQWDRVYKIARYGVLFNLAIMLVIAGLIFAFAEFGVRLFIQDSEAVKFGKEYLQMIGFFYPFLGINFILNGIVRAAGAMYQVLVLNIISFWVLRYPLAELCSYYVGEQGVALGMGLSFVFSSLIAYLYYIWGKWSKKDLFEGDQELDETQKHKAVEKLEKT